MNTAILDREGNTIINGIGINHSVFSEELVEYNLVYLEEQINDLIRWISELRADRMCDRYMMLEDLKMLMNLDDVYIFSSNSTNDYVSPSKDLKKFNSICKEILKLNGDKK